MIPLLVSVPQDSVWESVFPSTLRILQTEYNCPSGLAASAFTHKALFSAQVLSCGVADVCLLWLPALWVSYLRGHCQIQCRQSLYVPLFFVIVLF